MDTRIDAPWTQDIVMALNRWQRGEATPHYHPFTCGANHTKIPGGRAWEGVESVTMTVDGRTSTVDNPEVTVYPVGARPVPVEVVLKAVPEGWVCPEPGCGYTQAWAHDFMAGGEARRRLFLLDGSETAFFDPVDLYEAEIDQWLDEDTPPDRTWVVQEHLVLPAISHFPRAEDVLYRIAEDVCDSSEITEGFGDELENIEKDPALILAMQRVLEMMAARVNYRMCGPELAKHVISLPGPIVADAEANPLWDGEPLYRTAAV